MIEGRAERDAGEATRAMTARLTPADLELIGLHHITVPVSDPTVSQDWYCAVLGLVPLLIEESEDAVIAVTLEHQCGIMLMLRRSPAVARSLAGFVLLSLAVPSRIDLERWRTHVTELGGRCTPIAHGYLGWSFRVGDPDGIQIELHTREQFSEDAD